MVLGLGVKLRVIVFLFWGTKAEEAAILPLNFYYCWTRIRLTHWKRLALNKQSLGSFFVMAE